jgi:hypothetical protein
MRHRAFHRPLIATLSSALLLGLVLLAPSGSMAQGSKPPVISLKSFIQEGLWQLDITWSAKDSYDDEDWSAKLDLTATARFLLHQSDKRDDWGHWHAESVQSGNMAYSGFIIRKPKNTRTDYRSDAGRGIDGGVLFDVGGRTPGYQLTVDMAYPAKVTMPISGPMDTLVNLQTTDIFKSPPVFCTGPLPASGQTIHGSLVLNWEVPPFNSPLPKTRVGIQYVLQPVTNLAPLVPPKK